GLFWVFAELMCEEPHIINELDRRFPRRQITRNLVINPMTVRVVSLVEKLLKIDKIQAFPAGDRANESTDLKHLALLKTLNVIDEKAKIKFVPLPPFPLPLHPNIRQVWEMEVEESWKGEMESSLGKIKAGLLLRDEILLQKARDDLRNFWKTTSRRNKILDG